MNDAELAKIKTILEGADGPLLKSFIDSQCTKAIKSHDEKNPGLPELSKRIERLDSAASAKIKTLELNNKVLRSCYEKGIDYSLVENLGVQFEDEKDISKKLDALAKSIALKAKKDLNEMVAATAYKPQVGQSRDSDYGNISKAQYEGMDFATRVEYQSRKGGI